jgi:serine/threonine protein kinase
VAIKTVLFQSGPAENQLAKVASEAAIASNLHHNNVVVTYAHDICRVETPVDTNELTMFKFYLVQEYCNGRSLRDALERGYFTLERMPRRWAPIMGMLRGIAAGMEYIHGKRVCHGDLNPANVLLKVRPEERRRASVRCAM